MRAVLLGPALSVSVNDFKWQQAFQYYISPPSGLTEGVGEACVRDLIRGPVSPALGAASLANSAGMSREQQ